MTYCDSSAVVQLTQQFSASKTRTRHLSMRASWLHHLQNENVSTQLVPTAHQKADILTNGLTAYADTNLPENDFGSRCVMACEDAWDFQISEECVLGSHHVPDFHCRLR